EIPPEDGGEIRESPEAPEVKDTGRDKEKPIEIDEIPPEDGGEIRESPEAPEVKDTGRDKEKPIEIDETPPENGERPREMPEGPTVEAKTPAAADDEVETRQGATEQGVADVFRLFEAEPENGERRQEIPENADVEVKMETAAGEVETRKGEIERGVEDIFSEFDDVAEDGERRQEIPDFADVEVEMETAESEVETRKGEIERGMEDIFRGNDDAAEAGERRQETPEGPVDTEVAVEGESDEAATRTDEIERDVEDVFRSYDDAPEAGERRQEIPEVSVDIEMAVEGESDEAVTRTNEIERDVEDAEKVDIEREKSRLPRIIYAAFGMLVLLIAVTAFLVFKPSHVPFEDIPAKTKKAYDIHPLAQSDRIAEIKPLKTVSRQTSEPYKIKGAGPPESVFEAKGLAPDADRVTDLTDEIKTFLAKWKTAWENTVGDQGDIDAYMLFYSDDFTSKGLDKSGWEEEKSTTNRKKEWIRLELMDIHIDETVRDGRVEARFIQDYQSSNYSGISRKTLTLKKEDSGWKIVGVKETESINGSDAAEQKVQTDAGANRRHVYPYTIHIASYRDRERSNRLVKALRDDGILSFSSLVNISGKGVWHRISIGYYETTEDARNAALTIQKKKSFYTNIVEKPYAILVGIFDSDHELKSVESNLWSKGYTPYRVPEGGSRLYIGAYNSKEDAAGENQKLLNEHFAATVVKR
ncbi:MAG: SPOR domain-containing protein, partial [Deltaproteobacteria bacterium]|nr:SPOR domain-containing protein [Deltaproteobacteria bacterium]